MPAAAAPDLDLSTVHAVLLAGGQGSRLHELTARECKPALFFAGTRRIVDFTMANAVRSGLPRMLVATQYRPGTLARHLPARWGAAFAPGALTLRDGGRVGGAGYGGTAAAVRANAAEIDAAAPTELVVLAGDHVYRMDYAAMVAAHRASGAMATVAVATVPLAEACAFGVLAAGAEGRIASFHEKPLHPPAMPGDPARACVSMGIYVFDWRWLKAVLDAEGPGGATDFGQDILPRAVAEGVAFAHRPVEGGTEPYWRDVGTLDAYRSAQLDFLAGPLPFAPPPCEPCKRARTATRRSGPLPFGIELSSGISSPLWFLRPPEPATRWAGVARSVVLPGARVMPGARLHGAIVAPGTTVPAGLVVGEDPEEDATWFRRTQGGTTLITRDMIARRADARPRRLFLSRSSQTFPKRTPPC